MAKPIRLFNTASRSIEELQPLSPDQVTIYTCGPTVYWDAHIGNLRTYIFEDVLVKALRYLGYGVRRVMNITDVGHLVSDADDGEDKLEVGARREGITAWEVAKRYEAVFLADLDELGIERPQDLVRATDTIADQIRLIQELEAKGHTYLIDDGLYFDVSTFPAYGAMAHLNLEGQQAGARVEMNAGKRGPHDFALWKLSPPGSHRDMEWESPWGTGFPGWHIECSAIAMKILGDQIDIHCGGVDHIPIHHTNEIAQSESATGKEFAQIWMHGEFLQVDGGKMSKSLANVFTVADLKAHGVHPLAFRYFVYSASYRSKLNFTWEAVQAAQTAWQRLRAQVSSLGEGMEETDISHLEAYLAEDLNVPRLIAALWDLMKSDIPDAQKRWAASRIDQVLSLGLLEAGETEVIPVEIQSLADQRNQARLERNWAQADLLRDQIIAAGYLLEDKEQATLLTKAKK